MTDQRFLKETLDTKYYCLLDFNRHPLKKNRKLKYGHQWRRGCCAASVDVDVSLGCHRLWTSSHPDDDRPDGWIPLRLQGQCDLGRSSTPIGLCPTNVTNDTFDHRFLTLTLNTKYCIQLQPTLEQLYFTMTTKILLRCWCCSNKDEETSSELKDSLKFK